jgi:hypothetical protein
VPGSSARRQDSCKFNAVSSDGRPQKIALIADGCNSFQPTVGQKRSVTAKAMGFYGILVQYYTRLLTLYLICCSQKSVGRCRVMRGVHASLNRMPRRNPAQLFRPRQHSGSHCHATHSETPINLNHNLHYNLVVLSNASATSPTRSFYPRSKMSSAGLAVMLKPTLSYILLHPLIHPRPNPCSPLTTNGPANGSQMRMRCR